MKHLGGEFRNVTNELKVHARREVILASGAWVRETAIASQCGTALSFSTTERICHFGRAYARGRPCFDCRAFAA